MKRGLITCLVAVLVLALSAGPAFASSCSAEPCAAMRTMAAAMAEHGCAVTPASTQCPTSPDTLSARCTMRPERHASDQGASPAAAPQFATAAIGVAEPAPLTAVSAVPAPLGADARGAPHLITVIRI